MRTTIFLLVITTFVLGFVAGLLVRYYFDSKQINDLVEDNARLVVDNARLTMKHKGEIDRLDKLNSELSAKLAELIVKPKFHCSPIPRADDINWQELDFPNKGDKK